MDQQHSSPVTLFYSYAHEDEVLRNELEKHLRLLQHRGLITAWYDRQIVPGTDRDRIIDHHLNESSIILLLISSDFLASGYCYNVEMQHALERHRRGEAHVIPIILRPVDWQHSPFAHLQCLPRDGKPVTEWNNQDAAFRSIAEGLRQTIEQQISSAHPLSYRNYLRWLIERNYYLDPRGTFQTQRQVQVKIEEIYVSLMAQRNEMPGKTDLLLQEELASLETQLATSHATNEEIEDQREQALARFEPIYSTNRTCEVLELAVAVNRHDRIVILGDPGSGKTTLLRYLALKHAQALWQGEHEVSKDLGKACFPILIRIAEYAENDSWKKQPLSDFLAAYHSLHECPVHGLTNLLQSELVKGNCLVLLDGLDEIISADERRGIVQRIEDFMRFYGNTTNRFVITSRIVGYRSAPLETPLSHYVVREMDDQQIYAFLEHWCQAVEDAQTPELSFQERRRVAKREIDGIIRAIQTSPGVRCLAANPLLLRILALIHRTGAQLPQKRIELYKLTADTLAHTWRTAQGVPESALVTDEYLTRLLSKLAYWLHEHKPTGIATEQEVYTLLGQEWARIKGMSWDEENPDIEGEIKKFLQAVREHTGLFVERAPKRYGFMHLTFEEYYTARYLVARSKTRAQLIRQHLHDSRWEEPILLGLGFVGLDAPEDAAELLETAILAQGKDAQLLGFAPSKYEDLLGRDYLFALRCLGDGIPVDMRVMRKLIDKLSKDLLYKKGIAVFTLYQDALEDKISYLHNSSAEAMLLPYLFEALKEEDDDVSLSAAHCLVQLDRTSEEVVNVLLKALVHNNDSNVRRHAAWRLGSLKQVSSEVANALLQALTDDDSDVRYASAQQLRHLSRTSDEIVAALISTLMNSTHDIARHFAAQCLGGSGKKSDEVVRAMTYVLFNDTDTFVRGTAAEGLGQLGQGSGVVTALLQALHDSDSITRLSAVQCLGRLGYASTEVVTALVGYLKDKEPNMRIQATQSLGNLGTEFPSTSSIITTALLSALKDKSVTVRRIATEALGKVKHEADQEIAVQLRAITAKDATGFEAVVALRKLGEEISQDKVPLLLNKLRTGGDMMTRSEAATTLGQLTQIDELVIFALLDGLLDDSWIARTASAESLARLAQRFPNIRAAIEAELIRAIDDPKFDKPDDKKCSAHDYAFQAIWEMLIG